MLENDTCRNAVENYAIDVAQTELNIAIINALENASSALALESDVDASCIIILDWVICLYRFPPCLETNYKLILPCIETCETIYSFIAICYDAIVEHLHDVTVMDYFRDYRCRVTESYYDGYDKNHFATNQTQSSNCINASAG